MNFTKVKSEPNDGRADQPSRGGPVVHVRGDSETELDLLFSVLKNDSKQPGTTFRDKNLPLSFFNPPEPKPGGSHSREGSLDFGQGPQQLQANAGGLNAFHVRSHSSPAKLPVSLSLPNAGQHLKQGSGDLIGDNQTSKYFTNNTTNAWPTDQCKPHDIISAAGAVNQNKPHNGIANQPPGVAPGAGLMQQSSGVVVDNQAALGPLPQGWEQGVTAEGDLYFINHNDKTTSWYDPRIPKNLQKPGALKVGQQGALQPHRQTPQHSGALAQQPHNVLPQSNPMVKPQVQSVLQQPSHLAKQQQQFLQQQQQQQQQQLLLKQQQQLPPASQIRSTPSVLSGIGQTQQAPMRPLYVPDQIRLELQKLHKERERLAREQEENARKEQLLLKELVTHQAILQTTGGQDGSLNNLVQAGLMVNPAMQQMNISGVDPFLGQTVVGPDVHARQNSGDSGLGSCYSLPRTPEDFLGNVDVLNRHDIDGIQKKQQPHHAQQQQQFNDFAMNRPGSLGGLDMSQLSDPSLDPMPMESDELVSTLTDELGLGRDFLEMQMMDILL